MVKVRERFTLTIESDFEEIDDEMWMRVQENPQPFAENARKFFQDFFGDPIKVTKFHAEYIKLEDEVEEEV